MKEEKERKEKKKGPALTSKLKRSEERETDLDPEAEEVRGEGEEG